MPKRTLRSQGGSNEAWEIELVELVLQVLPLGLVSNVKLLSGANAFKRNGCLSELDQSADEEV